jgi:putative oxidoreductase
MRVLAPFAPHAYALLRIVSGLLFAQHGAQKLLGALGGRQVDPVSLLGLAGIIELVGGPLIALGLFAAPVAFIASGEMAAAYFMAHAPRSFWPVVSGGELPALYCFIFLLIAANGSGIWSLDNLRQPASRRAVRPDTTSREAQR